MKRPSRWPICTIHGHTNSRGASIVTARVATKSAPRTTRSPGIGLAISTSVAPHRMWAGLANPKYANAAKTAVPNVR